jgi:hypothetical protein
MKDAVSGDSANRSESAWHPILSGDEAGKAWETVEAIAADLRPLAGRPWSAEEAAATPTVTEERWAAIAGGQAGLALFFAYLDQARPDEGYDDLAFAALELAIDRMAVGGASQPRLYAGFPGVAWTVEHLQGEFIEEGDEDPGADIAAILRDYLGASPPLDPNYDLIGGLAGLGVYGLERMPRSGGRECVDLAVARLAELAEPVDIEGGTGLSWRTPHERVQPEVRDKYPEGNFNLGVAHGVPGILGFLTGALGAGFDVQTQLDAGIRWLLAQRLPEGSASSFGYVAAPGIDPLPSRLAWCYGDPGIVPILLAAARRAGEPDWEAAALSISRAAARRSMVTAARLSSEGSGVVDAGLCHGSAGLGHLFNRVYQATGDESVRDAARAWFKWTFAYRRPGEGFGGFIAFDADSQAQTGWFPIPGFLTGSAGVGLALLAALTGIEPAWDRLLLASIPS